MTVHLPFLVLVMLFKWLKDQLSFLRAGREDCDSVPAECPGWNWKMYVLWKQTRIFAPSLPPSLFITSHPILVMVQNSACYVSWSSVGSSPGALLYAVLLTLASETSICLLEKVSGAALEKIVVAIVQTRLPPKGSWTGGLSSVWQCWGSGTLKRRKVLRTLEMLPWEGTKVVLTGSWIILTRAS